MKFTPNDWEELIPPMSWYNALVGPVEVVTNMPCALYVNTPEGQEKLFGYGTNFFVEIAGEFSFRPHSAQTGFRSFRKRPDLSTLYEDPPEETEVFTNIDRMPDESGTVAEVTRALRMMEIERRAILSEIRSERASLEALRVSREDTELPSETVAVETVDPVTGEVS